MIEETNNSNSSLIFLFCKLDSATFVIHDGVYQLYFPLVNVDILSSICITNCFYILFLISRRNADVSLDLHNVVHDSKCFVDDVDGWNRFVENLCLQTGIGISADLCGAVEYFKSCAEQWNTHGRYFYGIVVSPDIADGFSCLRQSTDSENRC